MKRLITLLTVLILMMALALPAMAFTTDSAEKEKKIYDLKIYLVEYDDNDFFGVASLPPSARGYAKNEVIAFIIELSVPKGENPYPDYREIDTVGKNVTFAVTENSSLSKTTDNVGPLSPAWYSDNKEMAYTIYANTFDATEKAQVFKVLCFAKITDDEASITVSLTDGVSEPYWYAEPFNDIYVTLGGKDLYLRKNYNGSDGGYYTIRDDEYNLIHLYIDKNHKTVGMSINLYDDSPDHGEIFLGVNVRGELAIVDPDNPATILTEGNLYDDVMKVYDDIVVDLFGLDYLKMGNYLKDSFFEDLVSPDTIVATVDIAPWTAYVAVPDNIVTDPPKTGDAANILGFVMVVLAAAAVVAVKKVRA